LYVEFLGNDGIAENDQRRNIWSSEERHNLIGYSTSTPLPLRQGRIFFALVMKKNGYTYPDTRVIEFLRVYAFYWKFYLTDMVEKQYNVTT
jgi:hypothetical protein